MKLNNKGFATITIIYSFVLLISLIMFMIISTLKTDYDNGIEYTNDINETLDECLNKKEC